jgi:GNAT superfamily N-acetyltransferase
MKTTHRSYHEEEGDFRRLARFITDNNEDIRAYSTWCIGRFEGWKYAIYNPKLAYPDFCGSNAELWFDGFGRLAGFAISENGGTDFAILTLAGYRFLFEELLDWVLRSWRDRGPCLSIEVTARQTLEQDILQRRGFQRKSSFFRQTFDLTRPLPPRRELEEGFTIVDMATHPDYRAQRILLDEAFQGRSDVPEAELQREIRFYNLGQEKGPIYHPQTDINVVAADGRFVSTCEGLIDAHNAEADVERVATHSAFRRRGFARAAILECLYRLQEMGMRKAYIAGYSEAAVNLYASIADGEETTFYVYEETQTEANS